MRTATDSTNQALTGIHELRERSMDPRSQPAGSTPHFCTNLRPPIMSSVVPSASELLAASNSSLDLLLSAATDPSLDSSRCGKLVSHCRLFGGPLGVLTQQRNNIESNKAALSATNRVLLDCVEFLFSRRAADDTKVLLKFHRGIDEALAALNWPVCSSHAFHPAYNLNSVGFCIG
jgi:hypothetical protein